MELQTQWLGRAIAPTALKLGDLFLLNAGPTAYLALKVEGIEDGKPREYALLLRTFAAPSDDTDPFPRVIYLTSVPASLEAVQLLEGGEFVLRPQNDGAQSGFAPATGGTPNGALAVFEDGTTAIFVKASLMPQWFSLVSGKAPPSLPSVRLGPWQLIWRFGDQEMELLSLPEPDS